MDAQPIVTTIESARPGSKSRSGDWALIGWLAFVLFFFHILVSGRYGYFVDELYYLACSHHLDWGYVDQAPLVAVVTWFERVTLGDSLPALRFLPAVAAGLNHRAHRPRAGCPAVRRCAVLHRHHRGAALSRHRQPAYHECV